MKIVIAMDSFKGSLSAAEACRVTAQAIKSVVPSATVIERPLADGGEGTIEAIFSAHSGEYIGVTVMGPLPEMEVDAGFGWLKKEHIAIVEMAKASGLTLLRVEQLSPLRTTTYGTGQLIKAAQALKPKKLLLAVGGSATTDGGVGAAMALGWKFLDANGNPIGLGGAFLRDIARVIRPKRLDLCPIEVFCDVTNPLIGPSGAARVYAPQKGADSSAVELLETGMCNLCAVVGRDLSINMNIPGSGAAGGLAGGAYAFMGAKLVSGIDRIIEIVGFEELVKDCDCVITGEGCLDKQSLGGKVVSGVAKSTSRLGKKLYVIAGKVNLTREQCQQCGVTNVFELSEGCSIDYAIKNVRELLKAAAQKLAEVNFLN